MKEINRSNKSRHCGRGPAIQVVNKETTLINSLDPESMSGMTALFKRSAFTLIELLVVVLIIGILSAIALPQYQKAVEKSKATQALVMLRYVVDLQKAYFLANGEYAKKFNDLGAEIPWTGNTKGFTDPDAGLTDVLSNEDWSIQIENKRVVAIYVSRLKGPFTGAGLAYYISNGTIDEMKSLVGKNMCVEYLKGTIRFGAESGLKQGDYCQKVLGGQLEVPGSSARVYQLP